MPNLPANFSWMMTKEKSAENGRPSLISGSGGRTRTCDPAVNSRLLYQLSYAGSVWRRGPESNRCTRLCRPLRSHSATAPVWFTHHIRVLKTTGLNSKESELRRSFRDGQGIACDEVIWIKVTANLALLTSDKFEFPMIW